VELTNARRTTPRDSSFLFTHAGAVEKETCSWPTNSNGRSRMACTRSSRCPPSCCAADSEVSAFDQCEIKKARQVAVFDVGFVVWGGRQNKDRWIAKILRSQRTKTVRQDDK